MSEFNRFSTELWRVIEAWPELPKAMRMAIVALVQPTEQL